MKRSLPNLLAALALLLCAAAAAGASPVAAEREVSFRGAGGVRLSGTLTLGDGAAACARVPAAVLVCGSGPTDRNGNQPPLLWTGLLKQVADALAEGGVASLRYDKRGVGGSTRPPKDPAALARFVAWDHFVGDVVAARDALARQPEVDPDRLVLVGHSEGGLLVMRAAAVLHDAGRPPAAVVLLSTPGRPLDVLIGEQLEAAFRRQGLSARASAELLASNGRVVEAIRRLGEVPDDVPAALAPLYPPYAAGFLRSAFESDPPGLAAKVPGPVLVVQGDGDLQVSAERDAPALHAALRARPGAPRSDLLVLPGASHNLKKVPPQGGHAPLGPVVPEFRTGLAAWLAERLRAG